MNLKCKVLKKGLCARKRKTLKVECMKKVKKKLKVNMQAKQSAFKVNDLKIKQRNGILNHEQIIEDHLCVRCDF